MTKRLFFVLLLMVILVAGCSDIDARTTCIGDELILSCNVQVIDPGSSLLEGFAFGFLLVLAAIAMLGFGALSSEIF